MNEDLVKNLTSLIDETLVEIDELKKSRFSASEIKLDGPGEDGIAGKPASGELDAKKADDEKKDEDKKEDEEEKDEDKMDKMEDDMDKAEGKNSEADPGKRGVVDPVMAKYEERMKKMEERMDKMEGKNSEADPGKRGVVEPKMAKSEEETSEESRLEKSEEKKENGDDLIKSYIDEKVGGLEAKLSNLLEVVNQIGDQPAERKGVPAGVAPLKKSADEEESLSKSQVLDKMLELKKSGTFVPTEDFASVELDNNGNSINEMISKYGLK